MSFLLPDQPFDIDKNTEYIRLSTKAACEAADLSSERENIGWFASWEKKHTDPEGFLIGWGSDGAACRWLPYTEIDYLGINADHESPSYDSRLDTEARSVTVDPLELPDNAHWKGWVW